MEKQYKLLTVFIGLIFIFMTSMWTIDVSLSAMIHNAKLTIYLEDYGIEIDTVMTNGFWTNSPTKMYHVGLYTAIMSIFMMSLIVISFTRMVGENNE